MRCAGVLAGDVLARLDDERVHRPPADVDGLAAQHLVLDLELQVAGGERAAPRLADRRRAAAAAAAAASTRGRAWSC